MKAAGPSVEKLRPLGEGTTSRVELVRLLQPWHSLPAGLEVALKRPVSGDAAALQRARRAFAAEARAGALVRDPSLVHVLSEGSDQEGPFLLLQYVPGRSLREILAEEGALPEPLLRRVGEQLAGALAALHGADLIHGDVKPENVRLDEDGRAVLLDLGFARKRTKENPIGSAPGESLHAGSLAYLSPERARGAPASPAADVFGLGCVLYELATGVHPFGFVDDGHPTRVAAASLFGSSSGALFRRSIEVPGADQLLAAITTGRTRPPSHLVPELTPFLDAVVAELLQRVPHNRPEAHTATTWLREGESGSWWRRQLQEEESPPERPALRASYHMTPLVGRERELGVLAACLQAIRVRPDEGAARHGGPQGRVRSQVLWLAGPEGSGKWRLVNEFVARSRQMVHPPVYLYTRCNDRSEARPGGALLMLLHRYLQLPPGTPPQERDEERLRELIVPGATRALLRALGSQDQESSDHSPASALAEWLVALGLRAPLIVFLDDLHRAETETLIAINSLVDVLSETRILLVLGTRDDVEPFAPRRLERLRDQIESRSSREKHLGFRALELGPISEEDVRRMVDELFDRRVPRRRLAEALWLRSRGNPGHLTELLRELAERGTIRPKSESDPHLLLDIDPDELPLPRSVNKLIAERLRALKADERHWLERISVVGGRIEAEFLTRAFPPTKRAEVDAVLARLTRKNWLIPAATRYRFERPSLREVVYRSISPNRRRRLHGAAARGLQNDSSNEALYQRAFHLRAAQEHEALFEASVELVDILRERASPSRLLTVARWGLEALEQIETDPRRNPAHLQLLEAAAGAADRLGLRDEERAFLDHLVDLDVDPEKNPSEAARMYLLHGRYASGTGQFGLARGMLRSALQLSVRASDVSLESECLRRLAHVQAQIGDLDEAEKLGQRALSLAQSNEQRALALLALSVPALLQDRVEEALDHIDGAIEALRDERRASLGVVAHAQMLRARTLRSAGQPLRALGAGGRSVRLAQQSGERRLEAEARARFGRLLLDADRVEEAEGELRDALLVADRVEDRRGKILAQLMLGILLWESQDEQAFDSIQRARSLAEEIGFSRAEAVACALEARVHRERGDRNEADSCSLRASDLLARHGAELADRITIQGTRALVLDGLGRRSEAKAVMRAMRQELRERNRLIKDPALRRAQGQYMGRLLDAVRSPDGVVYPRTPAAQAPGPPASRTGRTADGNG